MPNYLRHRVPGGCYFFTVNLHQRHNNSLLTDHIETLQQAVHKTKAERPFQINAWVVLPDHMHWIWTLPPGDTNYSTRWQLIKMRFSRKLPITEHQSRVRQSRGERGIWQRRFWEHTIRDENDYTNHMNYIHFNPVKHGYVKQVSNWPHSSFHHWVERGVYPNDWAGCVDDKIDAGE